MLNIAKFLIAVLFITGSVVAQAETDEIETTLIESKKQYDSALEKVRLSLLEALNKKYTAATKAGDLKTVEAVQAEIESMKQTGKMPQSIPTKGFESQVKLACTRMEVAFAEAIRDYTKEGNIELAKAVQKELDDFKAKAPSLAAKVKDPFQPKSIWIGDAGQVLTVTERRGEAFRAIFKPRQNTERDVSGSIQKEKISWLAKNVNIIIGGAGGDNHGTLIADNMGHRIDFVWRDDRGSSGTFTLRLQAGK